MANKSKYFNCKISFKNPPKLIRIKSISLEFGPSHSSLPSMGPRNSWMSQKCSPCRRACRTFVICSIIVNKTEQICMWHCVFKLCPMFGLMSCQVPENVFPFISKRTQFNFPLSWQPSAQWWGKKKHWNYINIRGLSTGKLLIRPRTDWPTARTHLQDPKSVLTLFPRTRTRRRRQESAYSVLILLGNL